MNPIKAPEQSGAVLKERARFERNFLAVALFLLVLIFSFNFLINPYGLYPTKLLRPLVWSDRKEKIELLRSCVPQPEVLILGSSRMMRIDPALVEKLTGRPAFNLAVDHARTEDFLALLRYVIFSLGYVPSTVIVGVDVNNFRGYYEMDNLLTYYPELLYYLKEERQNRFVMAAETAWIKFIKGLSLHQSEKSFESCKRYLESGHWENSYQFSPNGDLIYNRQEDGNELRAERLKAGIERAIITYRYEFTGFGGFSEQRISYFRLLAALCHREHIRLVAVIEPYQGQFLEKMRGSEFERINQRWLDYIRQAALDQKIELIDAFDPQAFGYDPQGFYDEVHMTEANMDLLIEWVLRGGGAGGKDSF